MNCSIVIREQGGIMRIQLTMIGILAACLPTGVNAQGPDTLLFEQFQKVCLATDGASDAAATAAKALGYPVARVAKGATVTWDGEREFGGRVFAFRLTSETGARESGAPEVTHMCAIVTRGRAPASVAAARQWASWALSNDKGDGVTWYSYRQSPSGPTPIGVDAQGSALMALRAAVLAYELRTLSVRDTDAFSALLLIHATAK